jgi:hypothetical protein
MRVKSAAVWADNGYVLIRTGCNAAAAKDALGIIAYQMQ